MPEPENAGMGRVRGHPWTYLVLFDLLLLSLLILSTRLATFFHEVLGHDLSRPLWGHGQWNQDFSVRRRNAYYRFHAELGLPLCLWSHSAAY